MRGLKTFVNDNHVDNHLKEMLEFVYHGSIVNNRLNNVNKASTQLNNLCLLKDID